jgi:uncharacterized damage-inducible protein DinB
MPNSQQPLVDRYLAGGDQLTKSIAGLTAADLQAFPVPGTWSIQQIVIHVFDCELVHTDRMKRVIAEEKPLLMGFDETKFANRLHYDAQDSALAAELFAKNRQLMHQILSRLPDETFDRSGIHSERGRVTLADIVTTAANHLDHHLKFLHEKRRLLGKPLMDAHERS